MLGDAFPALQSCKRSAAPAVIRKNGLSGAPDARAVAQELVDLALVAIALAVAQMAHPKVLDEARDGLTRRVPEAEARGLELAVVQAAPVAQLVEHLLGHPQAKALER